MAIDEVSLGKALQRARKQAGFTQQELCGRAGISYSTLAKIERGAIKAPSIFTINGIAGALNTSVGDLLGSVLDDTSANAKKQSKTGVRFVYFDINGCLVRFFHRSFVALAETSGKPAHEVESFFWHHNDAVCRGDLPMQEFNQMFAKKLEMEPFDWRDYYLQAVEPISEMHDLLAWASKHYRIGLLSNIMPGQIEQLLQVGLLPALPYDVVIDSSKAGSIKPETAIFTLATKQANCSPEEILFVDDSRANVMAAERTGWKVLWFDDYHPNEGTAKVREALEY